MAGNQRFMAGNSEHPNQSLGRIKEISREQKPMAIILTCSDSRLAPEIIFDQGLGDLFVVRTAGHCLDNALLGSIEYAVLHLNTPLLIVLGHKRCGAVAAAVGGEDCAGHINDIVGYILLAVDKSAGGDEAGRLDKAVRANVARTAKKLQTSEAVISELVNKDKLKIVGAYYDLDTGGVEVID